MQQPRVKETSSTELGQETMFWQTIQSSTDPAEFEAYLDKFPRGTFAPLAKLKLEKLKRPQRSTRNESIEPGNILGNWRTTFGEMRFTRSGAKFVGVCPIGRVVGTLNGNALKGKWIEGSRSGDFQFRFSSDWRSFEGGWRMGAWDSWSTWTGSR